MCVIVGVDREGKRPSPRYVEAFWERNPEGAGIAWLDGKKVIFQKGLTLGEIQDLIKSAPLPYVAHFRIATCGGVIGRLTHPFIISEDSPLKLKGSTENPVLFHNGSWGGWEKRLADTLLFTGWKLPAGPWSDSRALAWLASKSGLGLLELLIEKQRIAVLDPSRGEMDLLGDDWSKIEDGFWVSNELWQGIYWAGQKGQTKEASSSPQKAEEVKSEASPLTANPMCETSQKPSGTTSLVDPRTTVIGPALRQITGPEKPSASSDEKGGPYAAGDPFPTTDDASSAFVRLVKVEKIWVKITEARTRHKIDAKRFKTLRGIYLKKRDQIQTLLRKEMMEEEEKWEQKREIPNPPQSKPSTPLVM